MAGVYARGSKIRVELKGRKWTVELKPTKTNIAALERQRNELKFRLDTGEDIDDLIAESQGKPQRKRIKTLGYYAQHYFDVVAPDGLADSTLMGYESAYNSHWLPFDNRPIDKIPITELQRHLSSKPIVKKTRRHVLSVLRLIFACAVPEVFSTNPIDAWTIPKSKNDEAVEPDPYEPAERDRLLAWLKSNNDIAWRYFLHGFGSGMRTGELLGAPWDHFESPYQRVEQEMVRREIKYHTKTIAREVLLPGFVLEMLKDNPTRFKKGLIHLQLNGKMFKDGDYLMRQWRLAHDATGVRKRTQPYPWRSTYISMMLSAGMEVIDVARWAGNSPDIIRRHYFKYIKNERKEEILKAKIEDALK